MKFCIYIVLVFLSCEFVTLHSQCSTTISSYPYDETFEAGFGLWVQSAGDDFDWTRDSGGTPSVNTGPSSGSQGSTWYLYTEASTPNHPSRDAIITGPCFDLTDPSIVNSVFSFDYHMFGANVGSLDVEVSTNGSSWTSLKTISSNQGNQWITCSISLNAYNGQTIYLRFFATTGNTGSGWSSDIAIDNIQLSTPSSSIVCTDVISTFPYTQNFELDFGFWTQASADDFDWTRDSGGTPSNNTGPSTGASGTTWYIYTEASTPNHPSRKAIITSPCIDLNGCYSNVGLEYSYHMFGSDVGSLTVEIATDTTLWDTLHFESGNKGNTWFTKVEDLSEYIGNTIQFRITGLTGSSSSGWSSDIAIDEFSITVSESPLADTDSDGIIDAIDVDDDNDGIPDYIENNVVLNDFNSQMILNGDATIISDNEFQLTPALNSQGGTVFAETRVNFSNSFSLRFELNLGTSNGGADGVTAIFHNDSDSTSAFGIIGQGLGAAGIEDGIVLEFDTWDNGVGAGIGEISNDHTGIWDSDDQSKILSPVVDFGNLEDGQWHDVIVFWDAECFKLGYSVDGIDAGGLSGDLVYHYFGGDSLVYYGFTASTGAANNDQRVRNVFITTIIDSFRDSDGDGVLDQVDLDSDNDGIWDAYEAGHMLGVLNGRITSSVGVNGLGDSLETIIDFDSINYSVSDSEMSPDSIYDAYEIDADGDGCLDTKENGISDNDNDGIAGTGIPTINTDGEVIGIAYSSPISLEWQNSNSFSACGKKIYVNPFVTSRLRPQ